MYMYIYIYLHIYVYVIQNQDGLACLLFCLNMGDLPKTNNAIEKREAWKQRILGFSMGLKV